MPHDSPRLCSPLARLVRTRCRPSLVDVRARAQPAYTEAETLLRTLGFRPLRYVGERRTIDDNDVAAYEHRQRLQCVRDTVEGNTVSRGGLAARHEILDAQGRPIRNVQARLE